MTGAVYIPSEWAKRYHACTVFELLGAGAAGVGKSLCLLMDPLSNILTEEKRCARGEFAPGESKGWALHLRRREGTLAQTINRARTMYPKIIPGTKWRDKSGPHGPWLIFPSGYKLQFGHCNNIMDYENYMSNEYDHVAFDELIEFDERQYENISGRCRSSDPILRGMRRVRAMSNPYQQASEGGGRAKVRNPFWVREYFVQHAPQGNVILERTFITSEGKEEERSRMFMPGTLADNPDRDFANDYEATLLSKPARIRDPLLKGNWYLTGGSFFNDWDNRIHIRQPFQIPDHWHIFRTLDWGFKTHGAILWFAQDDDGNLWCIKEYSYKGIFPDEISEAIRKIEEDDLGLHWRKNTSPLTGPADHDLWEERGSLNAEPKIWTFLKHGVRWVRANKKDPASNAQLFAARLRDHNNYTTDPGIMFFDICTKCITTIPSIQTSEDNPEVPLLTGRHHWYMAASYACAYTAGLTRTRAERPEDDWEEEERYNAPRKPGASTGYGIRY